MKIEKSNNPVAVGALVLVLALIVGRIVWMVVGHSASAAAASTASAGPPAPNLPPAPSVAAAPAAPAPEAARVSSPIPPVTPMTARNPFSMTLRPALAVARSVGLPHDPVTAHGTGSAVKAMPLMALAPLPAPILRPGSKADAKPPTPNHLVVLSPHRIAAQSEAESPLVLTLTATVGGIEPTAVVQTANAQPLILHIGDTLAGMHVVAIHEREVIFARGNGFWTLPLQSADGVAARPVSAASLPAASEPVVSVATPEEEIDAPQSK